MIRFLTIFIGLLLIITLVADCAKRGSPGGGPVDKIPPVVVSTIPKTDTVNVTINLEEIYIEFSERMNEGSVSQAIFISPPLDYDPEWSRSRKLKLVIDDSLLNNQTYVVSIGADASDERSNQMESSYQFAFSTGPNIDRGSISGKIYGLDKNETYNIFAFILTDSANMDFTDQQPGYISQSGKDGSYNLNYLKPDIYRIFAVLDQNNNLLINADYEKIGIPLKDIELTENRLIYNGLNFKITKLDTVAPFLVGVRPIHDKYIQARVSESIILNQETNFFIIDSLSQDTLKVLGRSQSFETDNIIDVFTAPMDTSARYQFFFSFMKDSSGNSNTNLQKLNFVANTVTDTTALEVIELIPTDSARAVHPGTPAYLEFSQPVDWQTVYDNFVIVNTRNDTISGGWNRLSVYNAEFKPAMPYTPDSAYTIIFNSGKTTDLWGNLFEDSLFTHYFTIMSSREMGEISGTVLADSQRQRSVYISCINIGRGRSGKNYNIRLNKPGDYKIEYLPDGQYRLRAFWDIDGNGQYSPGDLFPFKFSEPFTVREDTINVRKRWETAGIDLKLPNPESK